MFDFLIKARLYPLNVPQGAESWSRGSYKRYDKTLKPVNAYKTWEDLSFDECSCTRVEKRRLCQRNMKELKKLVRKPVKVFLQYTVERGKCGDLLFNSTSRKGKMWVCNFHEDDGYTTETCLLKLKMSHYFWKFLVNSICTRSINLEANLQNW